MTTIPPLSELLHWPPGQAPWAKQEWAHQRSSGEKIHALFMEQRTGKTIVVLGTCAYQYKRFIEHGGFTTPLADDPSPMASVRDLLPKKFVEPRQGAKTWTRVEPRIENLPKAPAVDFIYRPKHWAALGMDGLLVIAMPSGAPYNWAEEIDLRLPKSMNARALVWDSRKSDGAAFAKEFRDLVCHQGFAALLVNGEAIPTDDCKKAIGTFLRARRAIVVGDETSLVCSQPGNKRTHVMTAIRKLPGAICRRILDGTPGDESPLDLFAQVGFLDPKLLGENWTAFKAFYACWEVEQIWIKDKKTGKPTQVPVRKQAVEEDTGKKVYANLDVMARKLAPISTRVMRSECFDIPAKVRTRAYFDLSAAQRAVYDPLFAEFEAYLADGKHVSAPHVLARMVRLDQVRANYWPPEKIPTICGECGGDGCADCKEVGAIMSLTAKRVVDAKRNPLVEAALAGVLALNHEPGVVWCVFDETVDAAIAFAEKAGRRVVRYDGKVDDAEKLANKLAFQCGEANLMVAKEASAGRALNLSAAKWLCYLENKHSKRTRSQSEDRAEVAGRERGTGVIDVVARDTYEDEKKLLAHANKAGVSELLWGNMAKEWAS